MVPGMTLGEVLASEFVWVSPTSGTAPVRHRVVGPDLGPELHLGSKVALLSPAGTVRVVVPDDCHRTRREAVRRALERARGKVENHEKLLRQARQDVTQLEGLLREPEPADTPEPIGARP